MQKTDFTQGTTPRGKRHDDFVRRSCMQTFIVEPLLRNFVEPELSEKFDYSTLKLCPDNYITPELVNYYTDRLWSVDFKNSLQALQLLLLVEHKSFVPKRIHIFFNTFKKQPNGKSSDYGENPSQTHKKRLLFYL